MRHGGDEAWRNSFLAEVYKFNIVFSKSYRAQRKVYPADFRLFKTVLTFHKSQDHYNSKNLRHETRAAEIAIASAQKTTSVRLMEKSWGLTDSKEE